MNLALLLSLSLISDWEPVAAPAPGIWVKSGSQTWVKCQRLERDASGRLPLSDLRLSRRFSRSDSRSGWRSRVELCPQSPAILVYAAANELRQAYAMPTLSQPEQAIDQLGEQLATSRERAQGWLRRALVESRNRGQSPPPMLYFLIAQAAVAQGDLEQAKRALAQARTAGHIDSWRIDRLAATAAWMAGDLNDALTLAHRARGESRDDGLRLTRYILALIYDRAGAVAQSRNVLKELNARRIGTGEESIEMLLPLHERLYLTALENQAHANVADAMHYWKAYLARPEPADPERQQANLHLQALERPFGL